MTQPTPATCPLCGQPLAAEPSVTVPDNAPWRIGQPPVSVRVHRTCRDTQLPRADKWSKPQ